MQQAPQWLPYRVRDRLNQWRIHRALGGVNRTRPYPAADPSDAHAEASMLLCKRDLRLGVVAFKSLLRFDELKLAVTVINDGSLSAADIAWFDRHIPGARWQTWKQTDDPRLAEALNTYPNLAALYHSEYEPSAKLMHPLVLGRCDRIIQFDSDTAFFRRPDRLIDYCHGDDAAPLYMHDHQDETKAVPDVAHEAFNDLAEYVAPPGRSWRLEHRLFNAGMLAYRRDQMDLALAERYLDWLKTAPTRFTTGKLAIWFGPWKTGSPPGREQTAYHVMFALADPPAEPLGDDYRIGIDPTRVFNHFLRHYVVRQTTLDALREVIARL